MTYKFPEFDIQVVDPTLAINPIVQDVDPNSMTISVSITLTDVSGSYFGLNLKGVVVINLNYNSAELTTRVLENLAQYIVV